ncbi:MAG: outer membrane beta-barrel protein [Candidatus Brocadiaceae bacterium]|nr:outer membrane beta-barrel protein [Candidatus Brocadiaceae bacterium]
MRTGWRHTERSRSVIRKERCRPIDLILPNIKKCCYLAICLIISGIVCIQEAQTEEFKENLFQDKIVGLLSKIPESADRLYIGPLRIHPSLEISETYDDNVFYGDSSLVRDQQDFYETYEPKISLELPLRTHSLNFNYGFKILDYHDSSLEQDRVSRDWGGSADLNFANGFSILLSDRANINRIPGRFTRRTNATVTDPVDDPVDGEDEVLEQFGFNTFTQPRQFTNNVASVDINLPDFFNKLDFIVGYSNTDLSYKQRSFNDNDRNTHIFSGRIEIEPLPKTTISTGFEYEDIRYDKNEERDSIYRRASFDILWKATVKSYFFFNTKYNRRDYGRESIYSNFTGYDATLGYRFNITKSDNLLLKLEKSLVEQKFMINPDNSAEGENNPQDWTQINMTYTHYFPRRFSVALSPAIQKRSFRERQNLLGNSGNTVRKHQNITTLRLEVNGRYTTPHGWLFGEISYRYIDIRSNVAGGDMIKNEAQISIGISL